MNKEVHNIFLGLNESLKAALLNNMESEFNVIQPYLETIQTKISHLHKRESGLKDEVLLKNKLNHTLDLLELNVKIQQDLIGLNASDGCYNSIQEALEKAIAAALPFSVEVQDKARFFSGESDSLGLKFLKFFKRLFFYLSTLPLRTGNVFRKFRKKPLKEISYWKHNMQVDLVLKTWFYSCFLQKAVSLKTGFSRNLLELKASLFLLEKSLFEDDKEELPEAIDWNAFYKTQKEYLLKEIELFFKEKESPFVQLFEKAGTIEMPVFWMRHRLQSVSSKYEKSYFSDITLCQLRFESLIEKWKLRALLYSSIFRIKISYGQFLAQFVAKCREIIIPSFKKQEDYVVELQEALKLIDENDHTGLRSYIVKGIYRIKKTLALQVSQTSDLLFAESLLNSLDKLENDLNEIVSKLPEKVRVIRINDQQLSKIRVEENSFSLKEFIEFNSFSTFKKEIQKLKQEISFALETINVEAEGFHQIIDFCFDSALAVLDLHDNETAESPYSILAEGLMRAIEKNAELVRKVETLLANSSEFSTATITSMTETISSLQVMENIAEVNLKLSKAKMIEKSRIYRLRLINHALGFFTKARYRFKLSSKKASRILAVIKHRLRIEEAPSEISSDVSNFLIETAANINKLPTVYKRLFELKPIDEINLFQGRMNELNTIQHAYKDWLNGNYAATIVYGENGSGKSSLLKMFAEHSKTKHKVMFLPINNFFSSEKDFYTLISSLVQTEIKNQTELNDYFASLETRKIIMLDGVEKLFIRKINGYKCMQLLLELIAQTNKKVFWVLSSSLHAWNYINKVLQSNDYFDYRIELGNLDDEEVKRIISKRNRLSGYKINYIPDAKTLRSRKYQLLSEEKQQLVLEENYFVQLNRFAKSNISVALSYWLESIQQLKNHSLSIKSFKPPEFSFLTKLSENKIYTLLIIVFHGKISIEHHAEIFNHSIEKSRRILLVMSEDAILVKRDDYYFIHSIIFRHVINLLKNKNLIH